MGLRIRQLPLAIANQIAAGEVIERPASVVKELLENAWDAGASQISIDIAYGGLNQIKVSDNGRGICAEDLPLAIAPHATSKILSIDDLYAIESMGFRGEALASIASVSKLSISSKTADEAHAMMLQTQGGEVLNLSPCARSIGTTVDVFDLFFNTPVRKRFLKTEKLEFQAIEQVVKRFALSVPELALSLRHNGKEVLRCSAALHEKARLERMSKIFGRSFVKEAVFLDVSQGSMHLCAWLGGPENQRSQNDRQWVYVNQRMVKDRLIHHALKQAYEEILHPGRFPACLLHLTIDRSMVDVNVHPTKHELRFQTPREVHDFLSTQLSQALVTAFGEEGGVETSLTPSPGKILLPPILGEVNKAVSAGTSWVLLNQKYLLLFWQEKPYLVDGIHLQQYAAYCQLKRAGFPLNSRPLLVPVHYEYKQTSLEFPLTARDRSLQDLGIEMQWLSETTAVIRSIPLLTPHLDLSVFLDGFIHLKEPSTDELLRLLSQAQCFYLACISQEEEQALTQCLIDGLLEDALPNGLCKPLGMADCQRLLQHDTSDCIDA